MAVLRTAAVVVVVVVVMRPLIRLSYQRPPTLLGV
jgi:hypothetical protein